MLAEISDFVALLVWLVWRGVLDDPLAKLLQRWRRARYRREPSSDLLQATANEYVAVKAPTAAIAVAAVTSAGVRQAFAGRVAGRVSSPPDADTSFEIGSITKTFTAALLLALQQQGGPLLTTPLDSLLCTDKRPVEETPVPITLEHLATHHSGLPRLPMGLHMLAGICLTPRQPYRFMGTNALARWLRGHRVRNVGKRYGYSNLGYGLLGHALAHAAGVDYETALRQHVLDALSLKRTGLAEDGGAFAQPHRAIGLRTPRWRMGALAAAGGLKASLADMARWLEANMRQVPPLDARLHAPCLETSLPGRRVGLGWLIDGSGDATVIWHNGGTGGSRSFIGFMPALEIGVVVLASQACDVHELALRLLQQLASEHAAARNAGPSHVAMQ